MANNSATGGYLVPAGPDPLYDDALDDFFQAVFVGLTGMPGKYVRPRFQRNPPKQPDAGTDWCAVGVMDLERDAGPAIDKQAFVRHEEIHVLASFYGPNARTLATRAADGLAIVQNNDAMKLQLMLYVNNDTIRQVPELVNEQWIRRLDLPVRFRRQVKRTYEVEDLASAETKFVPG